MAQVAWLGTGLLGSGFVERLLERGVAVSVWNRTAAKAQPLGEKGAHVAASPAYAVQGATRVHLCLKDDAAVDEVLDAAEPAIPPGAVIIDHTTTSPEGAVVRGARMAAKNRPFLHAPVFMSPQAAREGKGIMMVSGARAVFDGIEAELKPMTGDLWYVDERLRGAASLKLVGNAMLIAIAGGMADVLTLGTSLGLGGGDVFEVLRRLNPGGAIAIRGKRMVDRDFAPTFELAMARKDLGLMLDSIADRPLATLAAIAQRADQLIERGLGDQDLGVLAVDATT
jgi:3-hydroxyisobutyrate dehydrogenase